ncbi:unnamed protein product [Cyclocybe aegerita]|uniref:Uncharacterized protein n=1 Tax=Cyclocybe aegerita TaxID=1973307 RepID=A0A8S0WJD9_CYCAE|nr:unnamed protein product [Cyclocybe aegerita]
MLCGTRKPPEDSQDAETSSSASYRSSIRGEHEGAEDHHFAVYCPVSQTLSAGSVYALSLMSSGNGFAPLEMLGVQGQSDKHFEQGISIGDVGYFHKNGRFTYLFNIFYPADDPIQTRHVPRKFSPVGPLSDWEIQKISDHFAPGAVVASEGVQVTQTSEPPRQIRFSSSAREGAVVVFPTGGAREDLADTSKLYPYIKEHAVDWYQSRNLYSGSENILPSPPGMNGTLFVVTGTDRATSCATALFPMDPDVAITSHLFEYDESLENAWVAEIPSARTTYVTESMQPGQRYSIFLRGITIALGAPSWLRHLPHIPAEDVPVYVALAKPLLPPQGRIGALLEQLRGLDKLAFPTNSKQVMFHPAMVLLQLMIDYEPSVDVAIVEDSTWCSLVGGRNLTHPQVVELLKKVIHSYEISIADGIATLVEKPEQKTRPSLHLVLKSLLPWAKPVSFQKKALRTLPAILHRPRSR